MSTLLKISEAAIRLGLSPASVRRLCDQGKLPSCRPMGSTGHRRIPKSAIDNYLISIVSEQAEDLSEVISKAKRVK